MLLQHPTLQMIYSPQEQAATDADDLKMEISGEKMMWEKGCLEGLYLF